MTHYTLTHIFRDGLSTYVFKTNREIEDLTEDLANELIKLLDIPFDREEESEYLALDTYNAEEIKELI